MKLKQLLLIAALVMPFSVNAAFVSSISNLEISGSYYDVQFYNTDSYTFNDLWDVDADKVFGEADGSIFNTAPTFWGDDSGAIAAATAIVDYLGSTHWTNPNNTTWDRVGVVTGYFSNGNVSVWGDIDGGLASDSITNFAKTPGGLGGGIAMATFTEVSAVPLPAALWLFGPALLGFMGFRRKAVNTDAASA